VGASSIQIISEQTLMLVVLRPEAGQELLEAQAWYESKALGLGFLPVPLTRQ